MGKRANVFMVEEEGATGIYLYSHINSSELPLVVQTTLKRAVERWDDRNYLSVSILFNMVHGGEMAIAGFGTSTYLTDNQNAVVVVDVDHRTIGFATPGEEPASYISWTFDDFVALPEETMLTAYKSCELSAMTAR